MFSRPLFSSASLAARTLHFRLSSKCPVKDESREDTSFSNSRPQDLDAKREEFRKYLERAGVIDAFTKVLVMLYEETEKPDDALGYVSKYLSSTTEQKGETYALKKELESAKEQIAELEAKLQKCELESSSA